MLVTTTPSVKIMAPQPGVVVTQHVEEGQLVKPGDPLITVSLDRAAINGGKFAVRSLDALEARKRLNEFQISLTNSRARAERVRLEDVIDAAIQQVDSFREQIRLQQEVVDSNQQIFDRIATVVDRGFISKFEFESRKQALISSKQSLASLMQRLQSAQADREQASNQLQNLAIESQQSASQLEDTRLALSSEQTRLEAEQGYAVLAPIGGRVTALAASPGRLVTQTKPLMVIVPERSRLHAELYAPTRAVGLIQPGNETRILYDAYPYQRFGSYEGQIKTISRIAIDPREAEVPLPFEEPVYRITVQLRQQNVRTSMKTRQLQPGMTLTANIVLERQTFIEWLLQPLNAVSNRSQ
jgi:membrane fusion protein